MMSQAMAYCIPVDMVFGFPDLGMLDWGLFVAKNNLENHKNNYMAIIATPWLVSCAWMAIIENNTNYKSMAVY